MAKETTAIRLTFSWRGTDVKLERIVALAMFVPPSDPPAQGERSGFWFELHDGDGRVLYRRVMHSPMRNDVEVPSGDKARPLMRVPLKRGGPGRFEILAPADEAARVVVLFGSPPDQPTAAARELARFPLGGSA